MQNLRPPWTEHKEERSDRNHQNHVFPPDVVTQHQLRAPATGQSRQPSQCLASNQILFYPCQAAAMFHFSSDLDGPNMGIHYHARTVCGFTLFYFSASCTVMDPQSAGPRGPPPHPLHPRSPVCPALLPPWVIHRLSCVHPCQKTLAVLLRSIRDRRFNVTARGLNKRGFVEEPHLVFKALNRCACGAVT